MTKEEAVEILKISLEADKNGIKYCHDKVGMEALDMAIKALEQTKPKGEWRMSATETLDGQGVYECSVCGHYELVRYLYYCPNCGADMRGDSE